MWFIYIPLAILAAHSAYNRFVHPLARIPGPVLASITPLWLVWHAWHGRRPRLDLELHRRYGGIVRISPNEIIFSNADHFKEVYGAGTRFTKGRFYEAPTDTEASGVGSTYRVVRHSKCMSHDYDMDAYSPMTLERNWDHLDMLPEGNIEKLRIQKRFAGPIYSFSNAQRHERLMDHNIKRFLGRLNTMTGMPLDIYHEWEIMNVDIMTEFTFGQPYGAIEKGDDDHHMANMNRMWSWWGWIGYLPALNYFDKHWMPWKLFFDLNNTDLPVFPYCVGKMMEHSKAEEEGQQLTPCLHNDMRQLSRQNPQFVLNWGFRLSMTMLGAGVDTMSWTLAAVIVGIGMDPRVTAHVQAEVDAAIKAGSIVKGASVSYEEAAKLPYLQACLHEAMRLWPNIAISLPRIVPKGGIEIDGYYIPEGYTVGMQSKQLAFDEGIFGKDPQSFRPERFLNADKAQLSDMATRNLSFGGPSRKCPGKNVAWLCMSKVLASFYANFDLKVLNRLDGEPGPGGKVWREEGAFPTKWHGLEVEITAR